ncbi:MAG: SUMF1/EgtB/PvdO family nonheme iron enzyme [Treponema sp.]|jgi:hypothetical protein|nr:SUMF1/EgtB/PvdO family nonheme iron enzyme [Treponema sp.]
MFGKRPEGQAARVSTPAAEEDRVRLRPLFGVKPGHYLAVLYSLVLLLILFFVLWYPGLARPGSVAQVRSEPSGAAFRVDGVYRGTTPCDVFVPRGRHRLELSLPRFETLQWEAEFRGRVFGSRFLPLSHPVEGTLRAADPAAALALSAAEYAAWSFAGEPTAAWQIPQSLSEGAYRTGPQLEDGAGRDAAEGILMAAARFAVTRAALRDLSRAKFLADNGGRSPSPAGLYRSASDMLRYLSENPGFAETLAGLLPEDAVPALVESAWYRAAAADGPLPGGTDAGGGGTESMPAAGVSMPAALRLGDINFVPLPGKDGSAPFLIAAIEAPAAMFEQFVRERPQWGRDRLPDLIDKGLVNGDYLRPSEGRTAVSWYAAAAFCDWLGESLPPSMAGWELRLPFEAEWEYAAVFLPGMTGGAWEWCAEPFAPLNFLPAPPEAVDAVGSPQRPVRGGAVDPGTRASLPPELCSPFVSFRPVIALRNGVIHDGVVRDGREAPP